MVGRRIAYLRGFQPGERHGDIQRVAAQRMVEVRIECTAESETTRRGEGEKMMARPECPGEGEDYLCAYIERTNASRPPSMFKKVLWCVGVALVAAMYALLAWADA